MPDFGKRASGGESLDAIAYSDRVLDALAAQRRVPPSDAGDAELFALLGDWRDGVRAPSTTHVISERDALLALHEGLSAVPAPAKRRHRGLTLVASIAAAVLAIGGFGAVVSGAGPGDPLYGLRTAFLGEPQTVRDDRVSLAAQTEMAEAQKLIDNGDWQQAQQKLATASTSVQSVDDTARKQSLIDQWNQLAVKVSQRDPAASVPRSALPGPLQQLPLPSLPASLPSLPDLRLPSLPSNLPSLPDLHLPSNLPDFTLPSLPATMPSLPDLHLPSNLPQFTMPSLPSNLPSFTMPSLPETLPSFTMPSLPKSLPSLPQTRFERPPGTASGVAPASPISPTWSTPTTSSAPAVTEPSAAAPAAPAETSDAPAPTSAVTTTTTVAPRTREKPSEPAPDTQQPAPQPERTPDVVTTTMPRPAIELPIPGAS